MIGIEIIPPHVEMITPKHDPDWANRALKLIEECGRVSHKSEGRIKEGSAPGFINKIGITYGHESILEHMGFTACFVGSRSMSHQLVRHRLAAITQESQRFCDYTSEKKQEDADHKFLKVIMPPSIMNGSCGLWGKKVAINQEHGELFLVAEKVPLRVFLIELGKEKNMEGHWIENGAIWCANQVRDYLAYTGARERGVPSEDARSHLTNACKTEVYVTYNWRMWRHVMGHVKCGRALNDHAQWEIKGLFMDALRYFEEHIPLMVADLRDKQLVHKMINGDEFSQEEWQRFRTHWEPAAYVPASPEQLGEGIGGFWQFPIKVDGLKEGVASAKV
jgi:thymidylate synthase (FAD)